MEERVNMGRVASRAFQAIGAHPMAFIGLSLAIAGLPAAVLAAVQYSRTGTMENNPFAGFESTNLWVYVFGWAIVTAVTTALLSAVVTRATVTHLSGRKVDWTACAAMALKLAVPLIVISVLSTIGILIGYALLIVPGVMLSLAWSVIVPSYVQEKIGIFHAFRRSYDLTDGYKGNLFLLFIAFGIAAAILGYFVEQGAQAALNANEWVAFAVNGAFQGLSSMFWATLAASIYVELRNVKEGTEVDELASIFA